MISDADEMSVSIYAQKTMALATQVQTGSLTGAAATRAMHKVADDTLAHFRSWKHADPTDTRDMLVAWLRTYSAKVPVSQTYFAEVLLSVADLVAAGTLTPPPAVDTPPTTP